ncbi:DUF6777 domain-containing protein [Streptomyces sp. NPDC051907]|uniref:DUF6777 domain-containing protein n=1 Tax=Streptomyces sp. NPDC051907 TaxID=3155284 RepID=UPI0034245DFD
MRAPIRPWLGAVAALSVGLLASGCGGESSAADSPQVYLQPLAAPGPDPYTASTARASALSAKSPAPDPSAPASPAGSQTLRTFTGSTPGLYGGTQGVGSCDVERQVRYLHADKAKARAFGAAAGVDQAEVPGFLRGLTPVVLRADTRVTNHGFRDGAATGYQSVLQAGTAVLVDEYGAPRVRCACGNPLKPPVAVKGAVVHKGPRWAGFRPDQAVVVKASPQVVVNLVIVDVADDAWIERRTGTDGEEDRAPEMPPPVHPDDVFRDPSDPSPSPSPTDTATTAPTAPTAPLDPGQPTVPTDPVAPDSVVPPPVDPPVDPPLDPETPDEQQVAPSEPDPFVPAGEPADTDTLLG